MASSPILITISRNRGTIINNILFRRAWEETCFDRVYPEPVEGLSMKIQARGSCGGVYPERSRRDQERFLLNHSI